MRYYKMDAEKVDDLVFETPHSTLFNLKAHIDPNVAIRAYTPHQKIINVPVKERAGSYFIALAPQFRVQVPTGIIFSIPVKFQLRVTPNKELSTVYGVTILDGMEVYDNDYTEEVKVTLFNHSDTPVYINSNDIIAQATLNKVLEYTLDPTDRKVAVKTFTKDEDSKEKEEE